MYKGTKFNSKKETVRGEEYLGIRIYRFYMKCSRCKAEYVLYFPASFLTIYQIYHQDRPKEQ